MGFAPCSSERLGLSVGTTFSLSFEAAPPTPSWPRLAATTRAFRSPASPCAQGWWSAPGTTDGRACDVGSDGHGKTNRCFRIWTRSSGGSRDDEPARRSLTGRTTGEKREDAAGKAQPFPKAGGGAENKALAASVRCRSMWKLRGALREERLRPTRPAAIDGLGSAHLRCRSSKECNIVGCIRRRFLDILAQHDTSGQEGPTMAGSAKMIQSIWRRPLFYAAPQ